jgi:hypothetical protein
LQSGLKALKPGFAQTRRSALPKQELALVSARGRFEL